jgi:hypothetical protein
MSMPRGPTKNAVLDPIGFTASDVTGLRRMAFDGVDGQRTAGDVAMSVASSMDLPTNVPWSLRDEQRARMLDQSAPLGSQVDRDTELVVIPTAHLG